jgi:ribosome maturation factor RimP
MAGVGRNALIEMFEPAVTGMGYELVDVELVGSGGNRTVRLYIDSESGVTVDDCAAVSEVISDLLDEEDPIPEAYNLEVSSPGVDRPLRRREDYDRFSGETVKVKTYGPVSGQRSFTGTLLGIEAEEVVIHTPEGWFRIPLDQVAKAHLVADI